MFRKMRWVAAVLVAALLTAGAAQAWAPPTRPAPTAQEEGDMLVAFWDWLLSLVAGSGDARVEGDAGSVQEKSGCGMDPDGNTLCK